ncbi:VTC domain-containing protein [Cellulomonas sp. H30R-01]|uniref:VTC domain-containing protein n=1 Tax=Cellulomonas sp. H30R-01 TaxID=2704467 RepID=UPI001EE49887|nr:VTC domain-containing protein [Cellulomonas sp. H30R-01]
MTPDVLHRLTPVTLDELLADAALQTRVDRKYVLPVSALDLLLDELDPATRVLEIDGRRTSAYRSVYFDTPALSSYLGAARRRRRRFKVRTRTYVDDGACWVEVKTRGPRGTTVKDRRPHTGPAALDDAACSFAAAALGDERSATLDGPLLPTLVTTYDRVTLHVPGASGARDVHVPRDADAPRAAAGGAPGAGPSRASVGGPAEVGAARPTATWRSGTAASRTTVDTGLVWTDPSTGRSLPLRGLAIVETKTGSTPSSTDRLLWRHGHRPVRVSKYGTGLAVLHPDLPATPWRRVLDQHVAAATR